MLSEFIDFNSGTFTVNSVIVVHHRKYISVQIVNTKHFGGPGAGLQSLKAKYYPVEEKDITHFLIKGTQ